MIGCQRHFSPAASVLFGHIDTHRASAAGPGSASVRNVHLTSREPRGIAAWRKDAREADPRLQRVTSPSVARGAAGLRRRHRLEMRLQAPPMLQSRGEAPGRRSSLSLQHGDTLRSSRVRDRARGRSARSPQAAAIGFHDRACFFTGLPFPHKTSISCEIRESRRNSFVERHQDDPDVIGAAHG